MSERKADKLAKVTAAENSFKPVAMDWHHAKVVRWATSETLLAICHGGVAVEITLACA